MLFRLTLILMLSIGPGVPLGFGGSWANPAAAAGGPMPGMTCGPDGSCCCVLVSACGCSIDAPEQMPAPKAPAPTPTQRPDLSAPLVEFHRASLPDAVRPSPAVRWANVSVDPAWDESSRALWNVWRT